MIIAVVHGYLLRGTGSNLYVSNLCRTFCRQGHQVLLFSQEEETEAFDFISSSETFAEDNLSTIINFKRITSYPGTCKHYRPNLAGMLPVYVYDHYPGFEVKEFTTLDEKELDNYIERNSIALENIFKHSGPDLVISQHTIMQPVYSSRALAKCRKENTRHLATVHGSALNFSVRKSSILRDYALEGIKSVDGLVFVSNHSRDDFIAYFSNVKNLEEKCHVIFAGVNTGLFQPLENREEKGGNIDKLKELLDKNAADKQGGKSSTEKAKFQEKLRSTANAADVSELISSFQGQSDSWAPDRDAADNLAGIDWLNEKIILYYGKYLWTKGIHLLLATMPLVLQKHRRARLILVGFGEAREYLEALVGLLDQGRIELALEILKKPGSFNEDGTDHTLYSDGLVKLLSDEQIASSYRKACKDRIGQQVIFTGIMDHEQLRLLIPCADVTVAPSIFPEAFGLVGVEALACGVLPVQTYHSGFADVVDIYEKNFHDIFTAAGIKHLTLDENLIPGLAANINAVLGHLESLTEDERADLARRAHNLAEEHFSWDKIAKNYLEL